MKLTFVNKHMSKLNGRSCEIIYDYGWDFQKCRVRFNDGAEVLAYYGELQLEDNSFLGTRKDIVIEVVE